MVYDGWSSSLYAGCGGGILAYDSCVRMSKLIDLQPYSSQARLTVCVPANGSITVPPSGTARVMQVYGIASGNLPEHVVSL